MEKQSSGWVKPDNESTNIAFIKWEEGKKPGVGNLTVEFKSKARYVYREVEKQIFKDFKGAESAGSYLHHHIKGKYKYEAL